MDFRIPQPRFKHKIVVLYNLKAKMLTHRKYRELAAVIGVL